MERIRPTSNNSSNRPPASAHNPVAATHAYVGPSLASKILVILLIVVSVIFILSMGARLLQSAPGVGSAARVDGSQYQAVFLTNGQVYFGKLSGIKNDYVKLTDIYYLQVEQTVQPDQDQANGEDNDSEEPQISLRKLGNELHGPQDEMFIAREQILFWENLKDAKDGDDKVLSQVVNAIEEDKAAAEKKEDK